MTTTRLNTLALLCLLAASLPRHAATQHMRVDYPDGATVSPPELRFPFYTIGSGGTVRYQVLCPSTFPGLPAQPMLVTKVGMQIAGQERYGRFEIRFGTTTVASLSNCWTTNLPDQRLQKDLSGTVLPGGLQGASPVNQWVEFDLDFPFVRNPGEGLTLDIIASAATPGKWCMTATGGHERVYAAPYSGGTCGAIDPTAGIKLRIVFEPLGFLSYGQACPGTGGFRPSIGATGSSGIGNTTIVQLLGGLGGAPTGFLLGFSRAVSAFGPLPLPIGGGCDILTSMDVTAFLTASGSGPGTGTASFPLIVPNRPALKGVVVFCQWAQVDVNSPAAVPVTTSDALAIVVF